LPFRPYPPLGPSLLGYDPFSDLPQKHLARLVDRVVEATVEVKPWPDQPGQPPYHPHLLLKVLILAYATGQRSSRQIERLCEENMAFRFVTRGDTPSHSVICAARTNLQNELETCWNTMLTVADKKGMHRVGRIDVDSTKIRANVSIDSVVRQSDYDRFLPILKEILAEAQRQDTQEDAEIMGEGRHKKWLECHSFEVAVDAGLLVAAQSSQSGPDNGRLLGLVSAAQEQENSPLTDVTADSGYFGSDNLIELESQGILTCSPDSFTACDLRKELPLGSTRPGKADVVPMTYDPDRDCYVCPENKILKLHGEQKHVAQTVRMYRAVSDCTDCPIRPQCMTNLSGKRRYLRVGIHQERIRAMTERCNEPEHRKRYHNRGKNVETIFAFSRTVLGFNRWMVRTKAKVAAEASLLAAAYQIRKLHTAAQRMT